MGGIGKTTIAKAVYNLIFRRFDSSSFVANVRENSEQHNGLAHLQEQLLSDVLMKKMTIDNVDRGINVIKDRLDCKRVLIVLDDVDKSNQLDALVGKRDWFGLGSRIIITTRDVHLLNHIGVDEKYEAKAMDYNESLQLFSQHAFRQDHPVKGYEELSNDVVHYAKGFPLALEVLGSFLCDKDISEWRSALEKLQKIPIDCIQGQLKISFDALDETEKNIFLHVACFFIGEDKNYAITILDSCDFFSEIGISVLVHRSLVKIDMDNKLQMHDLLRDMGREFVCKESLEEPRARSRLWFHADIHDVLTEHTGTKAVQALFLKDHILEGVPLRIEAFANMKNIKVLQVNYVQLASEHFSKELCSLREKQIFKKLRWLCWHGFNLEYMPTNFCLGNLVTLDMQHSSIREVWKEKKSLRKLEVLNLSHSHCLTRTPDFLGLPSLKVLMLEGCTSLVEVHQSIRHLERLLVLNLKDCKNLCNLPSSICEWKSLEELDISGCLKLDKLPESLGNMECLRKLIANETAIKQLPQSIVRLTNLKHLSLSRSKGSPSQSMISFFWSMISPRKNHHSITTLLTSFSGFCSLKHLILRDCNFSEGVIPSDIGSLSLLKRLDLSNSNVCSLPSSFGCLSRLLWLNLHNCTKLQSVPKLPSSIIGLCADDCTSLEMLSNLSNIKSLGNVTLQNCSKLIENKGLEGFESISAIQMERFLKGLADDGLFGIVLPMSEIPEWFEYQSTGSSMSLRLHSRMGYEIRGLIICFVYAAAKESIDATFYGELLIRSTIKCHGEVLARSAKQLGSVSRQDNIWVKYDKLFSHISFEDGMQVDVINDTEGGIQIMKCGVHAVCESCENGLDPMSPPYGVNGLDPIRPPYVKSSLDPIRPPYGLLGSVWPNRSIRHRKKRIQTAPVW